MAVPQHRGLPTLPETAGTAAYMVAVAAVEARQTAHIAQEPAVQAENTAEMAEMVGNGQAVKEQTETVEPIQ